MIHLLALAKLPGEDFAYHYATDDIEAFFKKKDELANVPEQVRSLISIHVVKTSSKDFESIQRMDPYFAGTTEVKSLQAFIERLQRKSSLTSVDVAGFIERRYQLNAFQLQKILYYVYADLLIQFKRSPFIANFLAYERGPVDRDVYKINKFEHDALIMNTGFDQKIFTVENGEVYSETIDRVVRTYEKYFASAWNNESKNLTHRPGTPWDRAHKKGYNKPISDKDILNYHHLETV